MAEQHLIDMLCMSGFDRDDSWGFRAVEPSRCCITSIALVLLKTGIRFSPEDGEPQPNEEELEGLEGVRVDNQQLATAQKLLLFWRKPAVSRLPSSVPGPRCLSLTRLPSVTFPYRSASVGGTASTSSCRIQTHLRPAPRKTVVRRRPLSRPPRPRRQT